MKFREQKYQLRSMISSLKSSAERLLKSPGKITKTSKVHHFFINESISEKNYSSEC